MADEYIIMKKSDMVTIADSVRSVTGKTNNLTLAEINEGILEAGNSSSGGGGSFLVMEKDINFYDYDGTLLYSYTLEEAQTLTELPMLPTQEGLVCQGWNYDLETIKSYNRAVNVGATYITDDGKTRIYIKLEEGRTSPMLGVCPNGTVDVDWGDGTAHNTLTGTSTSTVKWTSTHNYASAGEYVIKLTVTGSMGVYGSSSTNNYAYILRYSSTADIRNFVYQNAVQKVEIGNNVTSIGTYAFSYCHSLSNIVIPNSVTSIGNNAFSYCNSLSNIVIPNNVTSIGTYAFSYCRSLSNIVIPNSVTSIGTYAFNNCYSLSNIVIPNSVTSIGNNAFSYCQSLSNIVIPNSVTSISTYAFSNCHSLSNIVIPNNITSIGNNAFNYCQSLSNIVIPNSVTSISTGAFNICLSLSNIVIPNSVTKIGTNAFSNCYGVKFYDFSSCTSVPTLSSTNAFTKIPEDCEIRVPSALYEKWKAATNWATYASYIVAV